MLFNFLLFVKFMLFVGFMNISGAVGASINCERGWFELLGE
jgi:hypothetical protein